MKNDKTDYLQTNITTKLRFPCPWTKNYWAVQELSEKILYALPFAGVLMVVACARPITKTALFEFLVNKLSVHVEQLEKTLESLISKKIIVSVDNQQSCQSLFDNFLNWTRSGWGDSAHYHFFTWDTPFLDYSKEGGGYDVDRKNMTAYQELEPDTLRCKKYDAPLTEIPLPHLNSAILTKLTQNTLSEKVKLLLSYALGKNGEKPCHWTDIPLMRRTSPSGGSRHPTEGYFLSSNFEDIKEGSYHIQTDQTSLHLIPSEKQYSLEGIIKDSKFDIPPFGAIILTSIFEKNMYRYREPRTFRTIHMDVGHILASIEMLAKELCIKTHIHLNFNEDVILQQIGASKFEEGVMTVVTLHEEKY